MRIVVEGITDSVKDQTAIGNALNITPYWQSLGLSHDPFAKNSDSEAYYPVSRWQEHFTSLQRFRVGHSPLMVMPSLVGSGKSTLLQQFVRQQNDPVRIHYIAARPVFTLNNLLSQLSSTLRGQQDWENHLPEVYQQLQTLAKEVGSQLLIIDDAQRLSKDTLMRLIHLLYSQDLEVEQFRVVLAGEPQLYDRITSIVSECAPEVKVPHFTIHPLTTNQTKEYLHHRLLAANFEGRFPFSLSMIKQIVTLSGGYPGRINRVAQQVLIDFSKEDVTVPERIFEVAAKVFQAHKVKIWSGFFILFAGTVLWWTQLPTTMTIAKLKQTLPKQVSKLAQNDDRSAKSTSTFNLSITDEMKEQVALVEKSIPNAKFTHKMTGKTSERSSAKQNQITWATETILHALPQKSPQNQIAYSEQHYLGLDVMPHFKEPKQTTATKKMVAAIAKSTAVAEKVAAVSDHTNKLANLKTHSASSHTTKNGYTIQLLGVHDPSHLIAFVEENHLKNAKFYRTQLKGNDWYVLLLGQFSDVRQAKVAISKLPTGAQKQHPWVKKMSDVKSTVRTMQALNKTIEQRNHS